VGGGGGGGGGGVVHCVEYRFDPQVSEKHLVYLFSSSAVGLRGC